MPYPAEQDISAIPPEEMPVFPPDEFTDVPQNAIDLGRGGEAR